MKVYVVIGKSFNSGATNVCLHSVYTSIENARKEFACVRRQLSDWLASRCNENDFEIEYDSDMLFAAYDSGTGDYDVEVEIFEREVVD